MKRYFIIVCLITLFKGSGLLGQSSHGVLMPSSSSKFQVVEVDTSLISPIEKTLSIQFKIKEDSSFVNGKFPRYTSDSLFDDSISFQFEGFRVKESYYDTTSIHIKVLPWSETFSSDSIVYICSKVGDVYEIKLEFFYMVSFYRYDEWWTEEAWKQYHTSRKLRIGDNLRKFIYLNHKVGLDEKSGYYYPKGREFNDIQGVVIVFKNSLKGLEVDNVEWIYKD